jgi:hypothetical protein
MKLSKLQAIAEGKDSVPPHPGREESDAELKKIWAGFSAETKAAFGDTLKGFMAYRRGNYTEFFSKYHKSAVSAAAPVLDISTQTSIVEKVLRKAEAALPHECRYKSFEALQSMKEVEWVTQESSDEQGKEAAKTIAKLISKAGVKGWTVKVTIRDNYHGGVKTKWQGKAKS